MTIIRMILGLMAGLGLIYTSVIMEGGHISSTLQLTAFSLVFGGSLGVMLMAYPLRHHRRSFYLVFSKESGSPTELEIARNYFSTMSQAFVAFGMIGCILGLIQVMENFDKPDRIGPGIALAFVSLYYGFLVRIFCSGAMYDAVSEKLAIRVTSKSEFDQQPFGSANDHEITQLKTKIIELAVEIDRIKNDKAA